MISAGGPEAIDRGEFDVIISELHGAVLLLQHALIWACPNPSAVYENLVSHMGGLGVLHYGNPLRSRTAHTTVNFHEALRSRFHFAGFQRGPTGWPAIPPAHIEVFVDQGSGDVRTRLIVTGQVLGSFARDWLIWIAFHPFFFHRSPETPRLRLGRCIVQRRAWTIGVEELDGGRFDGIDVRLALAVERLRANRGLPRWMFIRPTPAALGPITMVGRHKDRKPILVDLESYLGMDLLAHRIRKYHEIEAVEMLPEPHRLCWHESTGRYCFEIR